MARLWTVLDKNDCVKNIMTLSIIATGIRTGKSIAVTYNGPYHNSRPPHVQTQQNPQSGESYILGKRTTKVLNDGRYVVMYEVDGLTDGRFPAHITVYYGSSDGAIDY